MNKSLRARIAALEGPPPTAVKDGTRKGNKAMCGGDDHGED